MSVRFNGIKQSDPSSLAKIIFAALLSVCATSWADNTRSSAGPARSATEQGLVLEDQAKASASDTEVTRKIRENLVNDRSLSTSAQNVQIITLGETVTLKGVVASLDEKSKVIAIANRNGPTKQVVSELQVRTE